jgi:hypothetical protein
LLLIFSKIKAVLGSTLNVVGKYINNDFCIYKIYLNARFL